MPHHRARALNDPAVVMEENLQQYQVVMENHDPDVTYCCVPNGCHLDGDPIRVDRLDEAVKVICNNEQCQEGSYMHKLCFEQWEESVLTYLRSTGRARSWSEKQRLQNLWTKKGYDLAYKACGCKCGKGHLRKDLDFVPPRAPRVVEEPCGAKKRRGAEERAAGHADAQLEHVQHGLGLGQPPQLGRLPAVAHGAQAALLLGPARAPQLRQHLQPAPGLLVVQHAAAPQDQLVPHQDGGRGQPRQRRDALLHPVHPQRQQGEPHRLRALPHHHEHLRPLPADRRHLLPVAAPAQQGLRAGQGGRARAVPQRRVHGLPGGLEQRAAVPLLPGALAGLRPHPGQHVLVRHLRGHPLLLGAAPLQ